MQIEAQKDGFQVRKGPHFDVHWCADMPTFLQALGAAINIENPTLRPEPQSCYAMHFAVQDSYERHGICGFVDVPKRHYFLCVDTMRASRTDFDKMTVNFLQRYREKLLQSSTTSDPAPHKLFLDSVGYEIFHSPH